MAEDLTNNLNQRVRKLLAECQEIESNINRAASEWRRRRQ